MSLDREDLQKEVCKTLKLGASCFPETKERVCFYKADGDLVEGSADKVAFGAFPSSYTSQRFALSRRFKASLATKDANPSFEMLSLDKEGMKRHFEILED